MEAIQKEIRDLLVANWDDTNTSNAAPTITTGWYDEKRELPQISLVMPNETPDNTITGFTGLAPSTGKPLQHIDGELYSHLWVTEPSSPDGTNVKIFMHEMRMEARRIINDNWNSLDGYEFISWFGNDEPIAETERTPTMYHVPARVGYVYRD